MQGGVPRLYKTQMHGLGIIVDISSCWVARYDAL